MNDIKYRASRFDDALYAITGELGVLLRRLPERCKAHTEEFRLRAGKPLILTVAGAPMWVGDDGAAGL